MQTGALVGAAQAQHQNAVAGNKKYHFMMTDIRTLQSEHMSLGVKNSERK
jgi:hypothetical protein